MADRTENPADDAADPVDKTDKTDETLNAIYDNYESARETVDNEIAAEGDPAATSAEGTDGERDASGRFLKKDVVAKPTKDGGAKPAVAGAKPAATTATDAKPAVEAKPAGEGEQAASLQAPADWPAELKAQFAKVPTEGQPILLEISKNLQADYTRKSQAIAGERKRYETLNAAIAPIEAEARKFNVSTDVAIKGLWAAHALLLDPKTRLGAIKRIAADYDIDLTAAHNAEALPNIVQPNAAAASPELDQRLSKIEGELTRAQTAERETQTRQLTSTAQSWIDEKADDGSPKRPHMAALEKLHGSIFNASFQTHPEMPFTDRLQYAYDAACAADPAIRQKMIDDAAAARTAQTIGQDRTRGTRAAAASSVNVSRAGASRAQSSNPADINAKLNEIWERRHGTA